MKSIVPAEISNPGDKLIAGEYGRISQMFNDEPGVQTCAVIMDDGRIAGNIVYISDADKTDRNRIIYTPLYKDLQEYFILNERGGRRYIASNDNDGKPAFLEVDFDREGFINRLKGYKYTNFETLGDPTPSPTGRHRTEN